VIGCDAGAPVGEADKNAYQIPDGLSCGEDSDGNPCGTYDTLESSDDCPVKE